LLALVQQLTWQSQCALPPDEVVGPCSELTVKDTTDMQLGDVRQQQAAARQAYATQAFALSPALSEEVRIARTASFLRSLKTMWRLPWENTHKDILWRLAVNGVPGAGGLGICHQHPCVCGHQLTHAQRQAGDSTAHRVHSFWECPVAMAVRQQLQRGAPGVQIHLWNLWLLQPPPRSGIRPVVWRVVALAALEAMDSGRRFMWWHNRQQDALPAGSLQLACSRAAAVFCLSLHDFVRVAAVTTRSGWTEVSAAHPFLAVVDGRIIVTFPV
jgi:hypothetical protein